MGTPYNSLQNLTTNWVGVRFPPTYIFGDPLLTPTYIFNFIPTPPPDQKWNSPNSNSRARGESNKYNQFTIICVYRNQLVQFFMAVHNQVSTKSIAGKIQLNELSL